MDDDITNYSGDDMMYEIRNLISNSSVTRNTALCSGVFRNDMPLGETPVESEQENDFFNPQMESVKELGQMPLPAPSAKNPRGTIHCLSIIGQIEGHILLPPQNKTTKYEHVIPMIVAVRDNPEIDGLLVILNTVGGDVEAGLAISELISSMGKPTVSLVLGGGHSIGVPLAVAADYTFIAPSATMTIHPVRMNGTVVGVPQTYEYFDKMQERIIEFIASNSKITKDRVRELMLDTGKLAKDVGSIIVGVEAVEEKLIDSLGGLDDAVNRLYELIEERRRERDA